MLLLVVALGESPMARLIATFRYSMRSNPVHPATSASGRSVPTSNVLTRSIRTRRITDPAGVGNQRRERGSAQFTEPFAIATIRTDKITSNHCN